MKLCINAIFLLFLGCCLNAQSSIEADGSGKPIDLINSVLDPEEEEP